MKKSKQLLTGALTALFVMAAVAAFSPVSYAAEKAAPAKAVAQKKETGYVASKEGGKYHKPTCGIAGNIKPENKITFKSKAAAEKAGYTPCGVCKP